MHSCIERAVVYCSIMKIKTNLYAFFCVLFFSFASYVFAGDIALSSTPQDVVLYTLSTEEFQPETKVFTDHLVKNGLDQRAVQSYTQKSTFGFNAFSQEVIKQSTNATRVMVLFHFHGVEAGGCAGCKDSAQCFHGNLWADEGFISAQQIIDDFIAPLEGKEVVLFFWSCFSGHFAKKVEQLASKKVWGKSTPLALIATDNNNPTGTFAFPHPDFARMHSRFKHWESLQCAALYERMVSFKDFTQLVNCSETSFTFSFLSLNGGEFIDSVQFGFKDLAIKPLDELNQIALMYKNIEDKLGVVDVSNLRVIMVERERIYANLAYNDMWLSALVQNGVAPEHIHWIKAEGNVDPANSQVHALGDDLDFIESHHNVLLFIRGDDAVLGTTWQLLFDKDSYLNPSDIAGLVVPKLSKANRVLLLLGSTHADLGFDKLLPLLADAPLKSFAVVAFYSPKRDFNRMLLLGWPMGFLAPLYEGKFLFYPSSMYRELTMNSEECRQLALRSLLVFETMVSFESYLEFIQKGCHSYVPKELAVKTHGTQESDLKEFGFLPSAMPKLWYGW